MIFDKRQVVQRLFSATILLLLVTAALPSLCLAQDTENYGRILSMTEKAVSVQFGNRLISVGDEVNFWRISTLVDPVSGVERGSTKTLIGRGVVDDIGVGKVQVTIVEMESGKRLQMTDKVLLTGEGKVIVRKAKVGAIQELKADGGIVINLGHNNAVSEGDEFLIQRIETAVDSVTKKEMVTKQITVGRGRVSSVSDSSSVASQVQLRPGIVLDSTDRIVFNLPDQSSTVITTGDGKKLTQKTQVAGIQQLEKDGNMVIDLGKDDEISEGDEFLIQRFETIFDPVTKEMTEKKTVDIGRGKVSSVKDNASVASVVELLPGREVLDTDKVIFTKLEEAPPESVISEPPLVEKMQQDIEELKHEVSVLKAAIDSLGYEHALFKNEIETVLSQLMSGDIRGTKILIKNDEPITQKDSREVFESYKQAIDTCLRHDYRKAIDLFAGFVKRYPGSKLTENCQYWIAQSNFSMGHYEAAAEEFKSVITDSRYQHKDDDASIMLAITYYKLGRTADALAEFQNFVKRYPNSEYRSKVDSWIKRLSS